MCPSWTLLLHLSRTPVSFPTYRAGSPQAQALRQEIEGMLAKGALEIARDPGPGFYSRLFLVEKAFGGWRPVIDLSHLNEFVQLTSFKMETVAPVLVSVREGDFLASLDLKDAYFQIPIHRSSRKLLRFKSEGTVYQFQALCFGLSTAPQVFARVFAVVSAWAHSHGIRFLCYLDDWLVLSSLEREAKQAVQSLLSLCHTLRIVINEKSDLVPLQTAKYLGMTIDTEAGKVFLSLARVEKFLMVAESFCTMDAPPAQLWQVILGHLASLERLVPHGRLRMRTLQWHLKSHWSPRVRPSLTSSALATGSETGPVLVDGEGSSVDGGSIRDTCTGSSPVFGRVLFGMGSSLSRSTHVCGVVRPGEVAAHQSSRNEGSFLRPSGILRRCHRSSRDSDVRQLDGRGVRQQARGHGFPGPMLVGQPPSEMDGEFQHPSRCKVSTRTRQCPGRRRGQVVGTEWSLHPQVARALLRVWGNPSIDLFATCLNAKLPLYCSLVPDPQAIFEDAFRHPWDDLDLYAFPPFPLVGRVIARVRESTLVAMTLVTPLWPEKEWFADLLLLTQPPLALPWWDSLFRQPHCNLFHQGVHTLNLYEWRLSSVISESRAFREGLLESCQDASDLLPHDYTSREADLLWLVSWKGCCSSQRHRSSSRGLLDSLTP